MFHCLLVHARLVWGHPFNAKQIFRFYSNCSYLVAGHVFSLVEIEHLILRRQMTDPKVRFATSLIRVWHRTEADLEERPCLSAPGCGASCFACRPDWRLNLILNAGNFSSADKVVVFDSGCDDLFDQTVQGAIKYTLSNCGSVNADLVELPHSLYRYRGDAPRDKGFEDKDTEACWVRALLPDRDAGSTKVVYRKDYTWRMRDRLEPLPVLGPTNAVCTPSSGKSTPTITRNVFL